MTLDTLVENSHILGNTLPVCEETADLIETLLDIHSDDIELSLVETVNAISFENSNEVAYMLAFTKTETATALLNELIYWREVGRI